MPHEPVFYLLASLSVLVVGLSKGGFASGIGLLGVPLLSIVINPLQAAAILLPIYVAMDALALRAFWRQWDTQILRFMLPGALLGTLLGFATASLISVDGLRIIVGVISILYGAHALMGRQNKAARAASAAGGVFYGTAAGFTSFSVHAGTPPVLWYLMPQKLDKTTFQGTMVAFFFVVNWLKVVPYGLMGQLDASNLKVSLVLLPLAPLGVWLGRYLHGRISDVWFYRLVNIALLIIGFKLLLNL